MGHIQFFKYQGTGNDFILVDDRKGNFPLSNTTLIQQMCRRRFGVGADGLILLQQDNETDFLMNFYNPDGSQSYCGNGSRCAVHFANTLGIIGSECSFRAIDGVHLGKITEHAVEISIRPVNEILEQAEEGEQWLINTGSPHYIVFCADTEQVNLLEEARKIRYSDTFRDKGVNVNFVEITSPQSVRMRTYERGVEDETLSCGTGVTAAAIAHWRRGGEPGMVDVLTRGGRLKVKAAMQPDGSFTDVWLIGPAEQTFSGTFNY